MKSWPRYLPDLTTWFSWHSERGTLPEKWREMDLPAICRDMGVPAWRALKPWRAEMPGVAVRTEKSDSERVVLWETERGTLRSRWTRGPDGDWWQAEYPVKSAADLPAARLAAEERRYAVDRETAERMSAEQASGGVGLLALALPLRPWSELFHTFLGWSEGLMLFLEQEEALREIVAVLETALAGLVAETARMPGAIVLSPDNLDGQFIAPSAFDEHLAPSYAKSAGVLHEAGKILVVHVGGPVRGLLPGLSRAGVDCVEGVCGPPQGDTPPAEARSLCGGDTTIWGGIAQDFLMQNRSEADFQAAADAAFAFAKHDPKTVVGVADRVPVDALPERLEALARMR